MTFNEWCISQKDKVKQQFRQMMKYDFDFEKPKTIAEKFNWLKVYDSTFLKTFCSDKLKVREYVNDKIGKDLFLPILGVYDKFDEIDFSKLPKDYVIKCNHGSGMNIIVKNGNIDKIDAKRKIEKWMQTDYLHLLEFHYKPIQKKIFIEQYQNNGTQGLIDYKFWCFNGEPKFFTINSGNGHGPITYYNLDGSVFKYHRRDVPYNVNMRWDMPKNLNKMIEYAKILSSDFKFVRVDFYEINKEIGMSELTFIPGGGYIRYSDDGDLKIGEMLHL